MPLPEEQNIIKRMLSLKPLLMVVMIAGCSLSSDTNESEEVNIEHLAQHWVHSYEEESEESITQIYRPEGFKEFPSSWFRMQYIFYENNDCKWLYLSPVDAHHFKDGTWRFDSEENLIHIEQGDRTITYRIAELTEELLRLVPVMEDVK